MMVIIISIMSVSVKWFHLSFHFLLLKVALYSVLMPCIMIFPILNMEKIFFLLILLNSFLEDSQVLTNLMASQFVHSWHHFCVHVTVPSVGAPNAPIIWFSPKDSTRFWGGRRLSQRGREITLLVFLLSGCPKRNASFSPTLSQKNPSNWMFLPSTSCVSVSLYVFLTSSSSLCIFLFCFCLFVLGFLILVFLACLLFFSPKI